MARKQTFKAENVTVELDLTALDLFRHEATTGLLAVAEEALARTDVWDQPPYGQGLIRQGAASGWLDGEQVGGTADLPTGESTEGIVAYVGFPFPARFQEMGTVHQPARPRFAPAVLWAVSDLGAIIARHVRMLR